MSFEEYLEFEQAAAEKHEYVHGQLFAMAGTSDRHNRLALRLATLAEQSAGDCRVYLLEVKVRTLDGIGYYPDVFATCAEDDNHPYYKTKPCFIVEILSESTESTDRGEKLLNYRKIETLQSYVLLSQSSPRAEVYSRQEDGSWRYEVIEEDEVLSLPCLNLHVMLAELYQRL
jgi:Uma2 family endonuclease